MPPPTGQPPLTAHPSSGRRLPGIEGLRALAATTIVVYHVWGSASAEGAPFGIDGHSGHLMSNLALGVTLFFCLSGFLLYAPFAAALRRGEPLPDWRAYGRNRALRILPAFWVCALVAIVVLGLGAQRDGTLGRPGGAQELLQLFTLTTDWLPSTIGTGFPVTWSLAVEAVFYVVMPLLAAAATLAAGRWLRGRPLAAALLPVAVLLVAGLVTRVAVLRLTAAGWNDWYGPLETGFLGNCDLFAYGMAVAVLRIEVRDGRVRLPARWRRVAVPAAAVALAVAVWQLPVDLQLTASPWNSVVAVAMSVGLAAVVLPAGGAAPLQAVRALEWPPVVALGVISYSVFLWHQPVIDLLRELELTGSGRAGFAWNLALVSLVTLAVSAASYRFVEAPALARKRSMRREAPSRAAAPRRDRAIAN